MKYNIITAIGVLIVVVSMYIDTSLKHNSSDPVGTNLTFAMSIFGAMIVCTSAFFRWKNNKKRKDNVPGDNK